MKKEESINHKFNPFLIEVLKKHFGKNAKEVYRESLLLQYLGLKTFSVNKDSKSRANFASLYAIYVLVEDYISKGFKKKVKYDNYKGAEFSIIFKRQRQLPYGEKLQNHALNNRCNDEFRKFFPKTRDVPIIRNLVNKRYWINEKLLIVKVKTKKFNICNCIIDIIDQYSILRTTRFNTFFKKCISLKNNFKKEKFIELVKSQLLPSVDARIFEIVSFCILKEYYLLQNFSLYKTGRTNANDGGIDFVMRPLGRFFQVTEVLDFKKYFLDIDKINRFPITFVIKSNKEPNELKTLIIKKAREEYEKEILKKYEEAIEEIISLPVLIERLGEVIKNNKVGDLLDDLMLYYKVEFNIK